MCKNATEQVSNLMIAVRPTLVGLMKTEGVPAATQTTVLAAFDAAQEQLANWEPGDTTETLVESLNAALAVVQALGNIIPAPAETLLSLVVGGIQAVLAIVTANTAVGKEAQAKAADEGLAKVQAAVPTFKLGFFDKARAELGDTGVASGHYKHQWNNQVAVVAKVEPKYASLKIA